jgi:hypothetical protein
MTIATVPGVYPVDVAVAGQTRSDTAIPAFLGMAGTEAQDGIPVAVRSWQQFESYFQAARTARLELRYAVRGFFENGGEMCYIIPYSRRFLLVEDILRDALAASEPLDDVDLLCAPDLIFFSGPRYSRPLLDPALQRVMLDHCRAVAGRFALLDSPPNLSFEALLAHRQQLDSDLGALYTPWLRVLGGDGSLVAIPPSGHVAGIYARSDRRFGVHKAPANEVVDGIVDVSRTFSATEAAGLAAGDVNYVRPANGRGIRLWGAWTLSSDPAWRHIPVRRLFLTVGRWLEQFMAQLTFEDNDIRLWARILRELSAYFDSLYRAGALQGSRPEQGYYVKCDAETNTPERIERGDVVTDIGLAPTVPGEFIVVRIVRSASGVSVAAS